MLSPN
jgi:hypothetical protein